MGDLLTLFGLVLGIITLESTIDVRTVSINRVTIAEEIRSEWGYTEDSIEQKLKDEAYLVTREARSYKRASRISTPNADGSIDKVARDAGVLRLLQRVQQGIGFLEYTVTGDILVDRGKVAMELRARRFDQQVIRARFERPKDQLDQLMRDAGWALVRLVDPHVACAALLRRSVKEGRPNPAAALRCIEEALPVVATPDRPWLLNLQGVTLAMLGRRGEAFTTFREALSLQPAFPQAWLNIGTMMAVDDRHQDAIKAYVTALSYGEGAEHGSEQTNAAALVMWALSLEKIGRGDEVVSKLREAFRADKSYDLPVRLLAERVPPDSREAAELEKIIAELSIPSGMLDWAPVYTDNLVGLMPLAAIFGTATTPVGR